MTGSVLVELHHNDALASCLVMTTWQPKREFTERNGVMSSKSSSSSIASSSLSQ